MGRAFGPAAGLDRPRVELVGIAVRPCGPDAADDVHRLTQLAFRDYEKLDPPSGAVGESEASVREDLERGGGALATIGTQIMGCLRFESEPGFLHVRRVAVDPAWQGRGVGTALMRWAERYALDAGIDEVRVGVRAQLIANLHFYAGLGYRVIGQHRHPGYDRVTWLEMARRV